MPFVDDPNAEETGNVAGANPLQQGSGPAAAPSAPSGDANQASAGGSATMESTQAGQQGQPTTSKKGPASSGMFTNIQKYVQKNIPQAKKMAGAVTQDFSKQAGEIRSAAESKQKEQAELLKLNEQKMAEEKKWATGQVGQVMGTTPAPEPTTPSPGAEATPPMMYNPSQEDADRFSAVAQDNLEGLGLADVSDLNLAQQQNRMAALGQLAGRAKTEQGRRDLLGQTFQKRGDYSRGMSGLDQLITSGDKAARESLIRGTQREAAGLGADLRGIAATQGGLLKDQDKAIGGFGKSISDLLYGEQGAVTGLESDIESKYGVVDDPNTPDIDESTGMIGEYSSMSKAIQDASAAGGDYKFNKDQLEKLGLTAGQNIYDLDLAGYISSKGPTMAQAMTPDQAAKLAALTKLSGADAHKYGVTAEQAAAEYDPASIISPEFQANLASAEERYGKEATQLESLTKQKPLYEKLAPIQNEIDKLNYEQQHAFTPDTDVAKRIAELENQAGAYKSQLSALQQPDFGSGYSYSNAFDQATFDKLLANQAGFRKIGGLQAVAPTVPSNKRTAN